MERNEKTTETTTQSMRFAKDDRRACLFTTYEGRYEGFFGGPDYFQAKQYGNDREKAEWEIFEWINHGMAPELTEEDHEQETDE